MDINEIFIFVITFNKNQIHFDHNEIILQSDNRSENDQPGLIKLL